MDRSRRTALGGLASALCGVLAGCQSGTQNTETQTSSPTATGTVSPTPTPMRTATQEPTATEGTPADTSALKRRTRSLVRALAAGEYQAAYDRMVGQLADQVSPSQLEQVWTNQAEQLGSFVEVGTVEYRGENEGQQLLRTRAVFEQGALDVIVGLTKEGVSTLLVRPGGEYSPPSYADQSKFTETELTLDAPGECSLGATLTLPAGSGQVPGVVLVHGNGAQDRNETVGPNKIFKDIAWGLASRGIAVLRYDKRTFACDVNEAEATVDDITTDDAITAIERLQKRERPKSVFVIGHSIGGTLAPRIASRADGVAGAVYMAGLLRPYHEAIVDQSRYLAKLDGTVTEQERQQLQQVKMIAEQIRTLDIDDDEVVNKFGGDEYYRSFQAYNPTTVAANLRIPQLVLQGERDWQVTVEEDLAMWRSAIGEKSNVTIRTYPKLNHFFIAGDGKPTQAEYFEPGNVSKNVVVDIAAFVEQNT